MSITFEEVNDKFVEWLKANGASVSESMSLHDYASEGAGRGVIATQDIEKDHELFSIPRSLLLSPETSQLSKEVDLSSLRGWSPLILCMIYEYCRGADSHWKPYFDILPTEFSTPMFWADEEIELLKGTGVYDKIGKGEAEDAFKTNLWPMIEANPTYFPVKSQEEYLQIFHRMGSLVMAYAFHDTKDEADMEEDADIDEDDEQEEDGDKMNVSMVPLADMLNHKTGHNNARLFHEKDCLRMVAIKPIKAGQQIYNTYGDLCNADLLRKYGFVDVPNPHDIAEINGQLVVEKSTAADPNGKEEKVEWLLENDGLEDHFIVEAGSEIPEELVGCIKILSMPLDTFQKTVVEGKKIPNTKLTVESQKILREILETRLSEFQSSAKEDRQILKQSSDECSRNKRNAVIVRSGERELLQGVLDKVKRWKPTPPPPAQTSGGKQKGAGKGQPPNKGKKPEAQQLEQAIIRLIEAVRTGQHPQSVLSSAASSVTSSPAEERSLFFPDTGREGRQSHKRRQSSSSSQTSGRNTHEGGYGKSSRTNSRQQQQRHLEQQHELIVEESTSIEDQLSILRDSYKDICEILIIYDLEAAAEKSIDDKLWRHVFHTAIEECRAELRKHLSEKSPELRHKILDDLNKIINKGTGFYTELISALRQQNDIQLDSIAIKLLMTSGEGSKSKNTASTKKQESSKRRSGRDPHPSGSQLAIDSGMERPIVSKEQVAVFIQKCLVYLGDLARYRVSVELENKRLKTSTPIQQAEMRRDEWLTARMFYRHAIQVWADSGKPHGQLAILASYVNDDLDTLYWYLQSLATKFTPPIVRDNLKIFFSKFQSRFRSSLAQWQSFSNNSSSAKQDDQEMSEMNASPPWDQFDLTLLIIKVQMDLFELQLESPTFHESAVQETLSTALLDSQLDHASSTPPTADALRSVFNRIDPSLVVIEFWISNWDQIWGMIRLEDKSAMHTEKLAQGFPLRVAAVAFIRAVVRFLNYFKDVPTFEHLQSPKKMQFRASCILEQDRLRFYGLLPFRRFHTQLIIGFDVAEDVVLTSWSRLQLFVTKVMESSEQIRGNIVELSSVESESGGAKVYRVLDAEDKRILRAQGSTILASHWLQDQVSALQKGLDHIGRMPASAKAEGAPGRPNPRNRQLYPLSSMPSKVILPVVASTSPPSHKQQASSDPKKGLISNYFRSVPGGSNASNGSKKPPLWTCVVDYSILVWHLSDIKHLLDRQKCLVIIPLDVIDRLDLAKKGNDKENLRAREAIRFLDGRMNTSMNGPPLLIAQNIKDGLSKWSESAKYIIQPSVEDVVQEKNREPPLEEGSGDMSLQEANTSMVHDGNERNQESLETAKALKDVEMKDCEKIDDDNDEGDEKEVEVRNAMNVPRLWRPILGACIAMLYKREEMQIDRSYFLLVTEDSDLASFARWFNIPVAGVKVWRSLVQ
ncbi:hypothetical protein BGW41_001858 [Actinomortierella wolfii]|nr:hypothetical protein BGW41_001858 [Actinomortierella wolfii]